MFTSSALEDLAERLAAHTPQGLDRFYFISSGSEAVETAIKLARQIQIARGNPDRQVLISRWKSYHGLTLGALAAAGRTSFRLPFYPMLRDAVHIPPAYCLRCSYGLTYPACHLRCALALDETIQNIGPDVVSAFVAETVGGASLAVCPPPPGYWPLVREICDRHQVLLILDEVMCGMGRTGKWFAAEHYHVVPDIMVLGKGISGGTLALSAVATSTAHMDMIRRKGGHFVHGGTFSHNSIACAAGLAAVRILEHEDLVERAAQLGLYLGHTLKEALVACPHVADIRGIGMMWGVELVREREKLTPFPRSEKVAEKLWQALFDRGYILYKSVGLAGMDGDGLIVAPPFVISEEEIRQVVNSLREVIYSLLPR
jgi:adenosylmethionine-8-amino-7-oxononanoate aminotransferase